MKNIEKYTDTKDALEAWNEYHDGGGDMSFAEWSQREYEAPRTPTLLEAAEAVTNTWNAKMPYGSLSRVARAIGHLADAIARETPVRNCDRYRTAKEAFYAFKKMCSTRRCEDCEFDKPGKSQRISCRFNWLYAEAGKDEAK